MWRATDWAPFQFLPEGLVKLQLGTLGNEVGEVEGYTEVRNTLSWFDRLSHLQVLSLDFESDCFTGSSMHVLGKLCLPQLQQLTLTFEHCTEFLELSFEHIPKACRVFCGSKIHLPHWT